MDLRAVAGTRTQGAVLGCASTMSPRSFGSSPVFDHHDRTRRSWTAPYATSAQATSSPGHLRTTANGHHRRHFSRRNLSAPGAFQNSIREIENVFRELIISSSFSFNFFLVVIVVFPFIGTICSCVFCSLEEVNIKFNFKFEENLMLFVCSCLVRVVRVCVVWILSGSICLRPALDRE